MVHLLSKSKYIRGLQCERALWLDVYNPRLGRYSREQMRRFNAGRDFEYSYKLLFPEGIDVSAELGRRVDDYPQYTARLLDSATAEEVLFEAGFLYDDVLVLADVVQRRVDGCLDVFEVKSGRELSETYKRDASVQYYVISQCRKVKSFSVVYNDGKGGFLTENLTDELASMVSTVRTNIDAMKQVLSSGEPDTPTGQHCLVPYACPYQHYCSQGVRQLSLF